MYLFSMSVNLAYRFIVGTLMITQANFFCEKMEIPLKCPIANEGIKVNIFPGDYIVGSFSIPADNYFFGFTDGYLARFKILEYVPTFNKRRESFEKRKTELFAKTSAIDEMEAYHLATNWFALGGGNLKKLNSECIYTVKQMSFRQPSKAGELSSMVELKTPLFTVEWQCKPEYHYPAGNVISELIIDGSEKKLVSWEINDKDFFSVKPLRVKDRDFSEEELNKYLEEDEEIKWFQEEKKRILKKGVNVDIGGDEYSPQQAVELCDIDIKRIEEQRRACFFIKNLISIPDKEFLKMDDTQKSNLVLRFVPPESFPPEKKKKADVEEK